MNLNLENKVVFVTGSSRGIGLSIAKSFLCEGAKVILNGRSKKELDVALNFCDSSNANAIVADLTRASDIDNLIKKIIDLYGQLDILVCNIGSGRSVPPGEESSEEFLRVFEINFLTASNIIQAVRPIMNKKNGSITCISSICGLEVIDGAPLTYSIAKAALNSYVKGIARPLSKEGIRINAIAPGNILFDGSVWDKKNKDFPLEVKKMLSKNVPLGRFGKPEDISNMVLWLSSDCAKFVTGSIFRVDGGQVRS